jgi:uncharacterized phage protein gp47/JayE
MPFDRPTLKTIISRIEADIESRLTGDTPLLAVAFLRILARVFGGAIHILYGWLSWLADQLFFDSAESTMLDRHARLWGLQRKAASFATGSIDFTGTNGTVIPSGTLLADSDGVQYETTAAATVSGGSATAAATASEPGDSGNASAGDSLDLVEPIAGITTSVVSSGGMTGGDDAESDAQLRARIRTRISSPPAGGTRSDFQTWAEEVDGIADAWAFGNTPSLGYVTVICKASGGTPIPSGAKLTEVENYITDRMPLTTNLFVEAIQPADIDIYMSVVPAAGATQAEAEALVLSNLNSYLDDVAAPGENVLISGIRNAISTTGIADYTITNIDKNLSANGVKDVEMGGFEYPVLNIVYFS